MSKVPFEVVLKWKEWSKFWVDAGITLKYYKNCIDLVEELRWEWIG